VSLEWSGSSRRPASTAARRSSTTGACSARSPGTGRARADRTGLPAQVIENGVATADDEERVAYLRTRLAQVARAVADGIDVRSFHYWSSFDNLECAEGYRPTFGLIGIDREDGLRRIVRRARTRTGRSPARDLSLL